MKRGRSCLGQGKYALVVLSFCTCGSSLVVTWAAVRTEEQSQDSELTRGVSQTALRRREGRGQRHDVLERSPSRDVRRESRGKDVFHSRHHAAFFEWHKRRPSQGPVCIIERMGGIRYRQRNV